ncbi:MAG TPA: type II secretion system protein [Candidatus Gastranaerophilaceae bacterium]|nr:type II secretion system protein [Candidatus Gastranaerophilaceae bacterium]
MKKTITYKKNKLKIAFTLAEVLIVIGIIGMIADLTLPNLIKTFQKQQYVTALKKAYSEFNQALIMLANDMGCPGDLKCTGLFDGNSNFSANANQNLGKEIIKYFKVTKNCETNASGKTTYGCFSNNILYDYNANPSQSGDYDDPQYYRFIILSGSSFRILNGNNNCSYNPSLPGLNGNLTQVCGTVMIDVNGPQKGPNSIGRDVFVFHIANGKGPKLHPYGSSETSSWWKDPDTNQIRYCDPADINTNNGSACTARIIEEGWQMNY